MNTWARIAGGVAVAGGVALAARSAGAATPPAACDPARVQARPISTVSTGETNEQKAAIPETVRYQLVCPGYGTGLSVPITAAIEGSATDPAGIALVTARWSPSPPRTPPASAATGSRP